MPEEQAFAILVKIMYDYQLRNLFLDNFKDLHVKFYQLDRLIEVSQSTLQFVEWMVFASGRESVERLIT